MEASGVETIVFVPAKGFEEGGGVRGDALG